MQARYRPLFPLASGGMADVWIGVQISDTGFSKLCAIKTIKKQSQAKEDFMTMFRDEATICQSLQHANIVQVLDFTTIEDGAALIMEYIPGVNLGDLMGIFREAEKPLPSAVVAYVAREIAKGLHYVHTRTNPVSEENLNIVHRDISPSNILLSDEGEVKITDFGIAKAALNSTETQVGVVKGKFQYMSPEQFSGKDIDHRSDVYALGCIMWEALAARRLFIADNDAQLIAKIANREKPPSLFALNIDADPELISLIEQLMESNVSQRTASAGVAVNRLSSVLSRIAPHFSAIDLAQFLKTHLGSGMEQAKVLVKKAMTEATSVSKSMPVAPPEIGSGNSGKLILDQTGSAITSTSAFQASGSTSPKSKTEIPVEESLAWQNTNIAAQQLSTRQKRQFKQKPRASVWQTLGNFIIVLGFMAILGAAFAHFALGVNVKQHSLEMKARVLELLKR